MRIAVLTLTRDRLAYSQHCFATLQANAGCDYDHYVVDNASTDGTGEWLDAEYEAGHVIAFSILRENVGICRALNLLLDEELNAADYDVLVRWDNDCEVVQPDTLRTVCEAALQHDAILAPRIDGLRNPPPTLARTVLGNDTINQVHHLGGVFMAIPAHLFTDGFRYDDTQPFWAGDELICPWWTARGGIVGYLDGWAVRHFLTTDGQETDDPGYWSRKTTEMAAA